MKTKIEKNSVPDPNTGCWLWTGGLNKGYGMTNWKRKLIKAHRLSYIAFKGEIKNKLWVLHKCDTPACVNPEHLFLGTGKDNTQDAFKKGRTNYQKNNHLYVKKGTEHKDAKLDMEKVKYIRNNYRPYDRRFSFEALAKTFNVSPPACRNAFTGKTWSHIK